MDWEQLTTIASFTWPVSDELYCHAHAQGVRIVKCVDFDAKQIGNATARSQWVASILVSVPPFPRRVTIFSTG
jgi:hypothetical protein